MVSFCEQSSNSMVSLKKFLDKLNKYHIGLGAFAASELDKVFSGYQPR
jgi:hypothetical protein